MTKFSLPDDLYGYQKEDSDRMASNANWLNFSEMGVGKTPETLAVIEKMGYQCPLIVCPNSLRLEWERQICDWVGEDITAVSSVDSYKKLEPIIYSFKNGQKYKVINYEAFRKSNNSELLNMMPFDCIVFDEIHKLRNPQTKLVKSIWDFLEGFSKVKTIGLSGSPIMNYPNDLYSPLAVCYPDKYPRRLANWKSFMYKYCFFSDGRFGPYIYGSRRLGELREETADFTIRRTKKEVLPFLPEKYYRRSLLEMQADQRKLYGQMEEDLRIILDTGEPLWSTNVLSLLTRLRQMNLDPKILGVTSSSAKTDFIVDLVESTDEKLVIFSTFEKYIYLLTLMLKETPHVVITGQVPPDERIQRVKTFQSDPSIKLCLGTIQTMGEGITLTAASNVVLVDRWWNQPTNDQAIDRLHRIGQKSAVQVLYPIVKNSVDEVLDSILERKAGTSDSYYQEGQVKQQVIEERLRGK